MSARHGNVGCIGTGSRSDSSVLTAFQAKVRGLIGQLGKDRDFALAGGAALIVSGVVDRATVDLDFFAPVGEAVEEFVDEVERHLTSLSFRTERTRDHPQYVRLLVRSGDDELMVDFGVDYRSLPAVETPDGLVLSAQDLAADKLLAFVGRREPRDLVDLTALEARYGLEELCRLAAEKDLGFRPAHIVLALKDIEADARVVSDAAIAARWREELAEIAPETKEPDFGLGF